MSMNVFNSSGTAFLGPQPFAFDRAKMLAGQPATFVSTGITGGSAEDSYLPADMDKLRMIFSDPDKFLAADEFLLVVVLVFVFGPGKLSLGWLFARKLVPQETGIAK